MKYTIRLDICTICNLNCPTCTMRILNYGKLGAGYIKFETYKKFIDDHKGRIKRIEISSAGEPFLNPDLVDILRYSKENNIEITCRNASNFNSLNDEKIKALVDYGVTEVAFACDGVRQENYEKYRRNGNVEKVFDAVRKIQAYKKQVGSEYPKLTWQYVIMESTEDDIELANELAKELEVPIYYKLTWDKSYVPKNPDKIKQLTGLDLLTRNEDTTYLTDSKCRQLWSFPAINWDGQLMGCCMNREPFNINVFELGLDEALKQKQYLDAKLFLTNRLDSDGSTPCMSCANGKFVRDNKLLDMSWILKQESHKFN